MVAIFIISPQGSPQTMVDLSMFVELSCTFLFVGWKERTSCSRCDEFLLQGYGASWTVQRCTQGPYLNPMTVLCLGETGEFHSQDRMIHFVRRVSSLLDGKLFTTSFQVSCGWDTVVDWSREPIVNISSQLHLQWILQLILWSQRWKSANTTNLLLSSQAAKGIKPLHFLSRKEQARTNVRLFSCRERENGHHPHADRLGGGKVSNQKTNVRSHSLCQALSKALYTPNPDTCLGSRTGTSMLLLAESETCIFKTYFKVLHLISFLFYSSLTSLKFFLKMPAKWE